MENKQAKLIYKYRTIKLFADDIRRSFLITNSRTGLILSFNLPSVVYLKSFFKDYHSVIGCYGHLRFNCSDKARGFDKIFVDRYMFLTKVHMVSSNYMMCSDMTGIMKSLDFIIKKYGNVLSNNKDKIMDTIKKIKSIKKVMD